MGLRLSVPDLPAGAEPVVAPYFGTVKSNRVTALLGLGIVLVGALLRYWGTLGDLWLDEIHSLEVVLRLERASEIFTSVPGDNNHHLNSLFLYALGWQEDWTVYRSLALVTGAAAVVMGGLIGWRRSALTGVTTALLLSLSFPLIVYSSEARGYAPAVLFALVAFYALQRRLEGGGHRFIGAYWVAGVLGFLSHLSFAHFFFAALLWSAWKLRRGRALRACAKELGRLHIVPLACVAVLFTLSASAMQIAGGPWIGIAPRIVQVCALALGIPYQASWIAVAPVAIVALSALGLLALRRAGSDLWIVYAATIVLVPALLLLARPPGTLFPRYFLIPLVFFLLLLGRLLAEWAERGRAGKLASIAVLLAISIGNGVQTARFLEHSRGHYLDGLRYMVDQTETAVVTVSSDHPYRNPMVMGFYERYLPSGRQIEYAGERYLPTATGVEYLAEGEWPDEGTEWFVVHSFERAPEPEESLDVRGVTYDLARSFDYYGLSGWHWIFYRRHMERDS